MSSSKLQSVWHLSFGDLITLLVGFFITTISLSPLNPATKKGVQSADIAGTSIALTSASSSKPTLGETSSKYKELTLWLQDKDFQPEAQRLTAAALIDVKKSINLEGYIVERAILAVCFKSEWLKPELTWEASKQRTLALSSQLIDSGLSQDVLEIRILGPLCTALVGPNEDVSAKLALKFRKR